MQGNAYSAYNYPNDMGGSASFYQLQTAPKSRYGTRLLIVTAVMAIMLGYAYKPDSLDRRATVSFIDVGQGDSIHIRTPEGKHVLIDGGGTFSYIKAGEEWRIRSDPYEVGSKTLVPLLMKRGVREIDLLVISHLDSDHIRGLAAVMETIPIRSIWWNGTIKDAEDVKLLLGQAFILIFPCMLLHAGMEYQLDGMTKLTVLWPLKKEHDSIKLEKKQNEGSVVLHVQALSTFILAIRRYQYGNGEGYHP